MAYLWSAALSLCILLPGSIATGIPLRIMSFNIWVSGENVQDGLYKVAKHIRLVDPDIVALQEVMTAEVFTNLTRLLGPQWTGVINTQSGYPDAGIFTKHKLISEEKGQVKKGVGVPVKIRKGSASITINLWSLHLEWSCYGPYAANNKQARHASQIMSGEEHCPDEFGSRAGNIRELLANPQFKKFASQVKESPLIVAGDFNSPSHLDWIEETKESHGGWAFEWPATKILMDQGHFADSYRVLHPNVTKDPGAIPPLKAAYRRVLGTTWSTVNEFFVMDRWGDWGYTIPEPMDRIDFIFYKSAALKPVDSFTYHGTEPMQSIPHHKYNDYPSDHYALVTDFIVSV
ncbi:Protein F14F9.5 [Aphelenchoides avenae]|nr:Protein F14F9.5 [Aphelenchus avenae]